MTTKEIAEVVGKDERSVRRWVRKASDKMPGLSDKMSDEEEGLLPELLALAIHLFGSVRAA